MTTVISDKEWNLINEFAGAIYQCEAHKELGKILSFISKRRNKGSKAGEDLDLFLDRLCNSGQLFSHTQNTAEYYKGIRKARQDYLKGINDGEQLARIIGWAKRLAPVYENVRSVSSSYSYSGNKTNAESAPKVNAQLSKLEALLAKSGSSDNEQEPASSKPPASTPVQYKPNDTVTVDIVSVSGIKCVGKIGETEFRFDGPTMVSAGRRAKIVLRACNNGVWSAKFKQYA